MTQASPPKRLADTTLDAIVQSLGMTERLGADGGPYMDLVSQLPMVQGSVGSFRVFEGGPLERLVTCTLVAAPMQLDSHMLFAFTKPDSAIPHFTLDSVKAGDHYAFHLDLIPRRDLGAELAYMDAVYGGLTEACEAARALDGLAPAHISPRQYAIMSPWMLVQRATEDAFQNIFPTVEHYRDHWLDLVNQGLPANATDGADAGALATRSERNRAIVFDPDVDPVWPRVAGLVGQDAVDRMRGILKGGPV